MGVFTVVGIVFVILKLVGVVDWSWLIVLLPFYGGFLVWVVVFVILAAFGISIFRKK